MNLFSALSRRFLEMLIGLAGLASVAHAATAGFTPTTPMKAARNLHQATLLADGRVLVAGGTGLSSAEVYNPGDATWTLTMPMTRVRSAFPTALLLNGQVLAVGGDVPGSGTATAEIFYPDMNMWMVAPPLYFVPNQSTLTRLVDGRVLHTGNLGGARVFSTDNPLWSNTSNAAASDRIQHAAVRLPNGKVLVMGGVSNSLPIATAILFDPATNSWSSASSMKEARQFPAAVVLANGKVLVCGGATWVPQQNWPPLATSEIYDPVTDEWSSTGPMFVARMRHSLALLPNGKVLAVGGAGNATAEAASAELYNPATGRWSSAGTMNSWRDYATTTVLVNGKVLITGGDDGHGAMASAELYDPTVTPPTPTNFQQQPQSGSINVTQDFAFMAGAYGEGTVTQQWYQGEAGDVSHPVSGATSYSFRPTPLAVGTYSYWCRAISSSGAVDSNTATVTVTPAVITGGGVIDVGQSASFRLLDVGNYTLNIQWQHDSVDIPGGTGPALNLSSAQVTDSGTYRLVVTTSAGVFISNELSLTVLPLVTAPPLLSVDLGDVRVFSGDAAMLHVEATSSGPVTYQWYEVSPGNVSTPVPAPVGGHTASLIVTNVVDGARYQATVTNSFGSTNTRVATVTVVPQATADALGVWNNAPVVPATLQPGFVANGNGKLAAIGSDGASWLTSDTGEIWTPAQTVPPAGTSLGTIAFGNGLFVAAGAAGRLYSSPDGVVWTLRELNVPELNLRKAVFGDGRFVVLGTPSGAAGTTTENLFLSTDGIAWTRAAVPTPHSFLGVTSNGTYSDVAAGNGRLVCTLPLNETTYLLTSNDGGLNWQTPVMVTGRFPAIAFGNGRFVVVGYISYDGLTWTRFTNPAGDQSAALDFAAGLFAMHISPRSFPLEPPNTQVWISTDGVTWRISTSGLYGATTAVVESLNGGLMMFGNTGPNRQNLHSAVFYTGSLPEQPLFMEQQPEGVTVTPLQKVTLTAVAGGGNPAYQWYLGTSGDVSHPISGANTNTLTPATLITSADYWVRATNSRGSVDSSTATIAISNAFLEISQTVAEGQSASFSFEDYWTHPGFHPGGPPVTTPGWPEVPATFAWEHNGNIIPDQSYRVLNLAAVHPADAGTYRVIITTAAGSLASNPVTLTVGTPLPTVFNTQPQGATFTAGGNINLYVNMGGQAPFTYQWYIGVSGDISHPVAGATALNLLVTPPVTTSYWVRVTNEFGHADSQTATATVVQPPAPTVFQTQPPGGSINTPRTLTLQALATGQGTVTYQWYVGTSGDLSHPVSGATSATFITPLLTATISYWVRASAAGGAANSSTATITFTGMSAPTFDPGGQWMMLREVEVAGVTAEGATQFQVDNLPPGLVLNKYNGKISGTPKTSGTYRLRIIARNVTQVSAPLAVSVVVAPLSPNVVGTFVGLVDRELNVNNGLGGRFNLSISASGQYTGSYMLGGVARAFKGVVSVHRDGSISGFGGPVLSRVEQPYVDFSVSASDSNLTGNAYLMSEAGISPYAVIHGVRNIWTGTVKPSAYAGNYSAILQLPEELAGDESYPQGTGYFVGTVNMNGAVTVSARLADNTVVTMATILSGSETIPVHWLAYGGTGSAQGWQKLMYSAASPLGAMIDGTVDWMKKAQPVKSTTRSYKAGIPLHELTTLGSKIIVPGRGQIELGLQDKPLNAMLEFEMAGLEDAVMVDLRISSANVPQLLRGSPITMTIDKVAGKFLGVYTANRIAAPYYGLFVPRLGYGIGHFQRAQSTSATSSVFSGSIMLRGQ